MNCLFIIVYFMPMIVFGGYPLSSPFDGLGVQGKIIPYNLIDTNPSCWWHGVCPMFPPGGELGTFPNSEEKFQHMLHNMHRMFANQSLGTTLGHWKNGANENAGLSVFYQYGSSCGSTSETRVPLYWYSDANQMARFKQWDESTCDQSWYSEPGNNDHVTCKWGSETVTPYPKNGTNYTTPSDRCSLFSKDNDCGFGARGSKFCVDSADRCWFETEGICGSNSCLKDAHCEPIFANKYDYVGKGFIAGMNGVASVYSRFQKEIFFLLPIATHFDERYRVVPRDLNPENKSFVLMLQYHDANDTQWPRRCYALYDGQLTNMPVYLSNEPFDGGSYNNRSNFYNREDKSVIFKAHFHPPTTCQPYSFLCKTSKGNLIRLPEDRDYYFGTEWIDWAWSNYSYELGLNCKENHYYKHSTEGWTVNGGPTLDQSDIWYYQDTLNYGSCLGCSYITVLECLEGCIYDDTVTASCLSNCGVTFAPTSITPSPTPSPTPAPTTAPTPSPTPAPSDPTKSPTDSPTPSPTAVPTDQPTKQPTPTPTEQPTPAPTDQPSKVPTPSPTEQPTPAPTDQPTRTPTDQPTDTPTLANAPTQYPSKSPTLVPIVGTANPTSITRDPTPSPTDDTASPTANTASPTADTTPPTANTASPTANTPSPTANTASPTVNTAVPTSNTQSPTASTPSPTGNTASPTSNTQSPTAITPSPTGDTASPTANTPSPTGSPTANTASPTANTPSPTGNTPSPTSVTIAPSKTPTSSPTYGAPTCTSIINYVTRWSRVTSWNENTDGAARLILAEQKFVDTYSDCQYTANALEFFYYFNLDDARSLLYIYMHVCCGAGKTFGSAYSVPSSVNNYDSYKANQAYNTKYGTGLVTKNEWTDPAQFGIKQYVVFSIIGLMVIGCCIGIIYGIKRHKKAKKKKKGGVGRKSRASKRNLAQTIQMHGLSAFPGPKHVAVPSTDRVSTDGSTDGDNRYRSRFIKHRDSSDGSLDGNVMQSLTIIPPMKALGHAVVPSVSFDTPTHKPRKHSDLEPPPTFSGLPPPQIEEDDDAADKEDLDI